MKNKEENLKKKKPSSTLKSKLNNVRGVSCDRLAVD